jgi:hypothetical protein
LTATLAPGYDIHYIVEKTPAKQDGFESTEIEAPDNLVRIPRWKHWEINTWYQTPNDEYDGETPRDYLRGRSWAERRQVGFLALRRMGVLKQ